MRQFQLYVRLHDCDQWSYGDTYTSAAMAWEAQLMARHRGFSTRVIRSGAAQANAGTNVVANA